MKIMTKYGSRMPEPDERFTFANERTFLAWNRTALALIAAGLGITQLLPQFAFVGARRVLGVPLIALGGYIAWASYRRLQANEDALRNGTPLPPSLLPRVLTLTVAFSAIVAVALAVFAERKA